MDIKKLFSNKIFIVATLIMAIILAIIGNISRPKNLVLQGTTPTNGSTVSPDHKDIRLSFSHELHQTSRPTIQVVPNTPHEVILEDKDLIIRFAESLKDQANYNVIVENLKGASGTTVDIVSLTFFVNDTTGLGNFKRSLPHEADRFSLWHIKDNEFYVIVRSRDFNAVKTAVEAIFTGAGLKPADYSINYDTNTSVFVGGEPSPAEQEILFEEGDESSVN